MSQPADPGEPKATVARLRPGRSSSVLRGLADMAQRLVDDAVAAVFPASCRCCAAPLEAEAVGRLPLRHAHPATGRLRRRFLGGLSAPLVLLCGRCASNLRAPREETSHLPHPLSGRAGFVCVSSFAPGPEIFALIHAFKYDGCIELAPWFGVHLAHAARRAARRVALPEVLLPVPLHPQRLRQRGFNQSELLAQESARRLGAAVDVARASRRRATRAQASRQIEERWDNLQGAFMARRALESDRVWLLDDVATSGATLHALGESLGLQTAGTAPGAAVHGQAPGLRRRATSAPGPGAAFALASTPGTPATVLVLCRARYDGDSAAPGQEP